jgi:hypothetical protein
MTKELQSEGMEDRRIEVLKTCNEGKHAMKASRRGFKPQENEKESPKASVQARMY